jgi:hypothetical protein
MPKTPGNRSDIDTGTDQLRRAVVPKGMQARGDLQPVSQPPIALGHRLRNEVTGAIGSEREDKNVLLGIDTQGSNPPLVTRALLAKNLNRLTVQRDPPLLMGLGLLEIPTTPAILGDTLTDHQQRAVEIDVGPSNGAQLAPQPSENPLTCVDLLMAYSNRLDLVSGLVSVVERLRARDGKEPETGRSVCSEQATRVWRVSDRVSETDLCSLITSYRAGTTVDALAEQFKISKSSVKRLLRQHGIRRTVPAA